jgi:hypothetical protein
MQKRQFVGTSAGGARPSLAEAMSRRQRAFVNPMPECFAALQRPGTGALRAVFRREDGRQPGCSRLYLNFHLTLSVREGLERWDNPAAGTTPGKTPWTKRLNSEK